MRVEGDTTLILIGPGRIECKEYASVFGARVKNAVVPQGKVYPFYFSSESEAEVEGDYILVKGNTIPKSWKKFTEKDFERIFTLGGVDCGKSSFCAYIVNVMGIEHVLDADVGQSDIAHPGAMGLGKREGEILELSNLNVVDVAFTGVISPQGYEARCLKAFAHLSKKVSGSAIVDTTGWVNGWRAREYKLAKMSIFDPDVVVYFGEEPHYLEDFNRYRLESFVIKKRDRNMRAVIRGKQYERWMRELEEVEFDVDKIKLRNTTILKGEEVRDEVLASFGDYIYAERGGDFLNIYSKSYEIGREGIRFLKDYFGVEDVNIISPEDLEGLILGLRKGERYLCPGILKEIDFSERKIKVVGRRESDIIEFGNFKLDEEMREVLVRIP